MFNKIKTNVLLRYDNHKLQNEINRLKSERKLLYYETEEKIIKTEDEYNKRLKDNLRMNDINWQNKYDKLVRKFSILRTDIDKEREDLKDAYESINEQATKIYHFGIKIEPAIERMNLFKAESINNAGTVKAEFEAFWINYSKFKNKILKLIEE
jgi:hypothetical protein